MLYKVIVFAIGLAMTVTSITYIIIYLNLLDIGYSFKDYLIFISRKLECWQLLLGILLIVSSVIMPRRDSSALYK